MGNEISVEDVLRRGVTIDGNALHQAPEPPNLKFETLEWAARQHPELLQRANDTLLGSAVAITQLSCFVGFMNKRIGNINLGSISRACDSHAVLAKATHAFNFIMEVLRKHSGAAMIDMKNFDAVLSEYWPEVQRRQSQFNLFSSVTDLMALGSICMRVGEQQDRLFARKPSGRARKISFELTAHAYMFMHNVMKVVGRFMAEAEALHAQRQQRGNNGMTDQDKQRLVAEALEKMKKREETKHEMQQSHLSQSSLDKPMPDTPPDAQPDDKPQVPSNTPNETLREALAGEADDGSQVNYVM